MAVQTPTWWALLSVCLLLAAPAGRAQSSACMKEEMKVSSHLERRGCFVDPFPTADPYQVVDGSSDTYAHVLDINATSLCFGWDYNLPDLWRYKMMPSIRLHVSSAGTISSRGTDDLFVVSVLRKAVEGVQQQIGPRISVFDDVSNCGGAVPGQNNCPSYQGPLPEAGCEELKVKLDWRVFQPHCEDAELGDAFQIGLVARVSTPGTAIYVLGAEVFYEQGAAVADEEEGAELSCAASDPNKPQAVAVASNDNDGTVAADRVDSFSQLTPQQQQQVLSQAGGSGFIPGPVVVVLVVNVNNTVIANGEGSVACLVQGNNNAQACVAGVGDGDRTAVVNAAPTAPPGTDSVNVDCFPFCDGDNPLSDVQAECFPFCPEG